MGDIGMTVFSDHATVCWCTGHSEGLGSSSVCTTMTNSIVSSKPCVWTFPSMERIGSCFIHARLPASPKVPDSGFVLEGLRVKTVCSREPGTWEVGCIFGEDKSVQT